MMQDLISQFLEKEHKFCIKNPKINANRIKSNLGSDWSWQSAVTLRNNTRKHFNNMPNA